MEIKYTNFLLNYEIFGKNEITAVFDHDGTFLYKNLYDIRKYQPKSRLPVRLFLKIGINKTMRELVENLLAELEISKELERRTLDKLSSSELYKILFIKICTSTAKSVILESMDTYLNFADLTRVLKTIKNYSKSINKNFIITTNKVDNSIQFVDRYIVVSNGNITYNGKDFSAINEPTNIKNFTELANARGAKLKDYKEANDLLKAIYRSIKK